MYEVYLLFFMNLKMYTDTASYLERITARHAIIKEGYKYERP